MISFAKKFLSIALALVLLVGVFPAVANAAGTSELQIFKEVDGVKASSPMKTDYTVDIGDVFTEADLESKYGAYAESQATEHEIFLHKWKRGSGAEVGNFELKDAAHGARALYTKAWQVEFHYKINGVDQGVTGQPPMKVAADTNINEALLNIKPVDPTKVAGMTFKGWEGTKNVTDDRIAYALWELPAATNPDVKLDLLTSNLSEDLNGETHKVKTINVPYGTKISTSYLDTLYTVPGDKIFVEWTYGNGDPIDGAALKTQRGVICYYKNMPTAPVAPKFDVAMRVRYTDGTEKYLGTLTAIEKDTLLAGLLKGYEPADIVGETFKGNWKIKLGSGALADVDASTKVTYDATVYAIMEKAGPYTVTVLDSDGDKVGSVAVSHNEKLTAGDLDEYEDKFHGSWKFVGSDAEVFATPITGNCSVKEVLRDANGKVSYTVRFLEKLPDGLLVKYSREISNGQIMLQMFPEINEKSLPKLVRQGYVFDGWALSDPYGNAIKDKNDNLTMYHWNTVFTADRSIDLVATWTEEAPVFLHIFVNGDVNHEYEVHLIENCRVGDTIDVSKIDVLDHYKNGNGRKTAEKVFGIYDWQLWRDYKLDGKARPLSGFHTVKGDTNSANLYAMVYDSSIKNNSKPDKTNPKTGDDSMIYATTAVMLISAGALAVFAMDRKRRKV